MDMRGVLAAGLMVLGFAHSAMAAAPVIPAGADWREIITPADQTRLDNLAATRASAIAEAEAAIAAKEQNALEASDFRAVLDAETIAATDQDVIGRYRCRVAKLGGQYLQLIRYPFFSCRIQQGPDGSLVIQKLSGSQRLIGRLWLEPDAMSYVYLGTTYVNDDQPIAYNVDPKENSVGRLYRTGPDRLRLELPTPYYESTMDVFELVRRR